MTQIRVEILDETGEWRPFLACRYKVLKELKTNGLRAFKAVNGRDLRVVAK